MNHDSHSLGQSEPLYIGFDEPVPSGPGDKTNRLGSIAMISGVVGLLSLAMSVSPLLQFLYFSGMIHRPNEVIVGGLPFLAMAFSTMAILAGTAGLLFRPRRLAACGLILGWVPFFVLMGWSQHFVDSMENRGVKSTHAADVMFTQSQISQAEKVLNQSQQESKNLLDGIAANRVVIGFVDAWQAELRYEPRESGFSISSAGPDGEFDTADDIRKFSSQRRFRAGVR